MSIVGINDRYEVNKVTKIERRSKAIPFVTIVHCSIISKITQPISSDSFDINDLKISPNVNLADTCLHCFAPEDLIMIGAELFLSLLLAGKMILGASHFARYGFWIHS